MCHGHDSRPPPPPSQGPIGESRAVTLTSEDGTELSAYFAAPPDLPRVGVVVLPDVRGLHPYYAALAERFAEAGLAAVAIDYFGRTAGPAGGELRAEDFDWEPHIKATTPESIDRDTSAAIDYLRGQVNPSLPVITVGFCFGGSQSWRQAGGILDLAGCAGFYGRPSMVGEAARTAHKPTVMLIAGDDVVTPVADQLELAATMRAGGAWVDDVVYEGAPHSFFDRSFGEWAEACEDAWRHVLALVDRAAGA
jgi:carboxymethylenebutenolidase